MQHHKTKYWNIICLILGLTLFQASCIRKNPAEELHGQLNLAFKFAMKNYAVVKDSLCGCNSGGSELYVYRSPSVIIRDQSGNKVYSAYNLEVIINGYPLREGKYSAQYKADLVDYTPCDSARDIWSIKTTDGSRVYCVQKNNVQYKALDSIEYFEIKRGKTTSIIRNF